MSNRIVDDGIDRITEHCGVTGPMLKAFGCKLQVIIESPMTVDDRIDNECEVSM